MRFRSMTIGLVLLSLLAAPIGCGSGDDKNSKDPVDLKIEEGDSFDPTKEKSK